jgi:transposase
MLGNGHVRFLRGRDGGNAVLLPDQALRPAVIWRKTSYGSQSERGREFAERMLTVVGTARLQRKNVLALLTATCEAALTGAAGPSLFST